MGKLKLGIGMLIDPKRKIIIAAFSGLLLGFLIFFVFDYLSKLFAEKNYNATNTIIVINKDNQRLSVYDVMDGKIKDYNVSLKGLSLLLVLKMPQIGLMTLKTEKDLCLVHMAPILLD
jgi:hypothetical protein